MNSNQAIVDIRCFHCGEDCTDDSIRLDEKYFCCEGCKTVFQLLDNHDLCIYYDLDEKPGQTVKTGFERKRFEYLEDEEVQNRLIDFRNASITSATFFVPNIHCTSCVWLLENLQKIDGGILKGTVNFLKRTVTILFDSSKTNLRNVVELLTTIGYEPNLKLEQLEGVKSANTQRGLWLKLGVAGFCFGNIMLFSFPEYLKMDQSGSSEMFRYFFGFLNIVLALPVLFYSAIDYLKSAWAALSQKGVNLDVPISIGIVALFGRSLYEILSGTGAGYLDSFTGFIFFLLIGKVVQKKTFDRLSFDRDYKSYLPISVIKIYEAKEKSIPVNKLQIGDEIIIRNQELVPADAVLESDHAEVDYSFITGETDPVRVSKGTIVFAGGKVLGTHARMVVSKKVEHSYLTQLWENEAFEKSSKDKTLTSFADRISPYFTISVLAIATLSLMIWFQIEPTKAFTIFTAVLIIACPCALALSTPFTLGASVNILALNGFYPRSTEVLEELSKANTFVFDKTGTITESEKSEVYYNGIPLDLSEVGLLSSACRQSIHPLSKRLFQTLEQQEVIMPESYHEIPGKGLFASFFGIPVVLGSRDFVLEQTHLSPADFPAVIGEGSKTHVAINGEYKGYYTFENKIRDGLSPLFRKLSLGHSTYLLSGDNEQEKEKLRKVFPGWTGMLFNQSPVQKLEFVEQLKKSEKHVIMIGDGLNDAGALQASNFGIAVSDDMSSFSPACDAIADEDALIELNTIVEFSKTSFRIIKASFAISLMYNITGLGFAITGHLSPLVAAILMPLSSVSIMAFTNLATRIKAKQAGLKIWA